MLWLRLALLLQKTLPLTSYLSETQDGRKGGYAFVVCGSLNPRPGCRNVLHVAEISCIRRGKALYLKVENV